MIEAIRKTVSSVTGVFDAMSATPCPWKNSSDPLRTTPSAKPTAGRRLRISPTLALTSAQRSPASVPTPPAAVRPAPPARGPEPTFLQLRVDGKEATGPVLVGRTSLARGCAEPMLVAKPGVMPMERLTAEDQLMLWPDEIWPQDIGALAVLDGSSLLDPDGRFRIEDVRDAIAGRLDLVPRFRQLLYVPPRRLGGRCGWTLPPLISLSTLRCFPFRRPATRPSSCSTRAAAPTTPGSVTPVVGDVVPHWTAGETRRAVRADAPRHRRRHGGRSHHCDVPRRSSGRGSSPARNGGYRHRCRRRVNSSTTSDVGANNNFAGRSRCSRTRWLRGGTCWPRGRRCASFSPTGRFPPPASTGSSARIATSRSSVAASS